MKNMLLLASCILLVVGCADGPKTLSEVESALKSSSNTNFAYLQEAKPIRVGKLTVRTTEIKFESEKIKKFAKIVDERLVLYRENRAYVSSLIKKYGDISIDRLPEEVKEKLTAIKKRLYENNRKIKPVTGVLIASRKAAFEKKGVRTLGSAFSDCRVNIEGFVSVMLRDRRNPSIPFATIVIIFTTHKDGSIAYDEDGTPKYEVRVGIEEK